MNFVINALPNEQVARRASLAAVAGSLLAACLPLGALAADPPPPDPSSQVMTEQQIEQALHPATTRSLTFGSRGLTRRDAAERRACGRMSGAKVADAISCMTVSLL